MFNSVFWVGARCDVQLGSGQDQRFSSGVLKMSEVEGSTYQLSLFLRIKEDISSLSVSENVPAGGQFIRSILQQTHHPEGF